MQRDLEQAYEDKESQTQVNFLASCFGKGFLFDPPEWNRKYSSKTADQFYSSCNRKCFKFAEFLGKSDLAMK